MASSSGEEDAGKEKRTEVGKYVRYTNEQVEALEKVYSECPKPSSMRRQQLIKEHPVLANIEPKQIKVWFQNRRCRERQRLESARLQTMNQKLSALNKLLVEENELATKKISQLTMENALLRQQLASMEGGSKVAGMLEAPRQTMSSLKEMLVSPQTPVNPFSMQDSILGGRRLVDSQDSLVTNALQQLNDARGDTNTSGLLQMAEDIKTEFLSKATGNALDFVDLPGLKNGRDLVGRVTIATSGTGVAARVAGIISLPALKIADLLKERTLWSRECRRCDVLGGFKTGTNGGVELIYTQLYAPTTLVTARDFCTLRYTCVQDDGGVVISERSLSSSHGGASMPVVPSFVRAEMLPSGFLIRPCQEGCIVVALDHMDLEPWSVPEQVRSLYDSSSALAHRTTAESLRFLRQTAEESATPSGAPQSQNMAWRVIGERIATGFNEAINGFSDDSWSILDSHDDLIVAARPTQKRPGSSAGPSFSDGPGPLGGGVICVKTTVVLQGVTPSALIRYLRENRSEWVDADPSDHLSMTNGLQRSENGDSQAPLPLSQAVDQREFLELVKLDQSAGNNSPLLPKENFLLQLCSGTEDPLPAQQAQLVFAPVDAASTADTVPLLPSGFRAIPLENKQQDLAGRTLDLTSALDSQSEAVRRASETPRIAVVIALQFIYENTSKMERVGLLGGQFLRNIVRTVQNIASRMSAAIMPGPSSSPSSSAPSNAETLLLSRRIMQSYKLFVGHDMVRPEVMQSGDSFLKAFWEHKDPILCVVWKLQLPPEHVFANQAGLQMMDATLSNLNEIQWDKSFDRDNGKPNIGIITQILQTGFVYLSTGVRLSRTGRSAGYERGVAWKVVDEDNNHQCIAFMHLNWSFLQ